MADEQQRARLIQAYLKTDNWQAAAAWLQVTAEADESFVAALIELTDAYRLRGSPSDAHYLGQHALHAAQARGTPVQQGLAGLLLGLLARHLGRIAEAEQRYAEAAGLLEQEQHPAGLANVLKAQGDLDRHLGRVAQAEQRYERAAELFQNEQNTLGLANTLQARGDLDSRLGRLTQAADRYEQAGQLFVQEGDSLGLANTLKAQGDLARRLGQVAEADRRYAEATQLFEQAQDQLGRANTILAQGDLARQLGRLAEADARYAEAAQLYQQQQNNLGLANTLRRWGNLAHQLGLVTAAEERYTEAAELFQREQDHLGLANTLMAQGDLDRRLDRVAQAEQRYTLAAELFRQQQDNLGLANTLKAQADLAGRLGQVEQAAARYEQAAELLVQEQDNLGLVNTLQAQGDLARHLGRPDAADLYERAAALFVQEQDKLGLANTFLSQAQLALLGDDTHAARALLGQALDSISSDGRPAVPWTYAQLQTTWAQSHRMDGNSQAAWERAGQAVEAFRQGAALLPTAVDRAAVSEQAGEAYTTAIEAALDLAGQADAAEHGAEAERWRLEAWRTAEEAKSLALLGLLENQALGQLRLRPDETDPQTRQLLEQLDRVEAAQRELLTVLGQSGLAGAGPPGRPTLMNNVRAVAEREALETERARLLQQLWARHQRLATVRPRTEVPQAAIQELLRQQQAGLVSYARLPGGRFTALVLRPEGTCQAVVLGQVTDHELEGLLIEQRQDPDGQLRLTHWFDYPAASRRFRDERRFAQLYGELWQPLEQAGALAGLEHVYVVPDGWLRALPFAALRGPGPDGQPQYLVERYALSVLFNAALLPHLEHARQRDRADASRDLAVVIDPTGDPYLAQVAAELEQRLAPRRPLPRPVNRAAFTRAVAEAGGVVFFGHGLVGGLLLQDGPYTAADILTRLDARGPAFLAACLLGLEHALHGLQGSSTVTALHLAGCPAVLAALWEVPARAAAEVLARVTACADAPEPRAWARALQQAQCDLLARPETADPYHWAGFCLYGLPGR